MVGCTDFVIQSTSKDIAVWCKKKTDQHNQLPKHGEVRLKCQEIHTTLLALFYAILRCNLTPGILGIEIAHSSIFNSIQLLRGSVLKEVGAGQMKRVSLTLFHSWSNIRNCTSLFETCHRNNSNWQGKMFSHQHTIASLLTASFSFLSKVSAPHSGRGAGRGLWQEQFRSSVQLHLHLLTKQLRESNILPSPVFSTMFALQPSSPLQTSFIPLQLPRLMEPRLTRYEAQVNLSKSDVAPKDERSFGGPCCEVWWGRRKERNGDDTNTQIQLHTSALHTSLLQFVSLFITFFKDLVQGRSYIWHDLREAFPCQQCCGQWHIAKRLRWVSALHGSIVTWCEGKWGANGLTTPQS